LSTVLRKHEYMKQFQFRQENEAIFHLSEMRNDLSHLNTNQLSLHDYKEKVQLFQSSLLVLGVNQKQIEEMIKRAGITSSDRARKFAEELYEKAKQHSKKDEFEQAISCFEKAICTPVCPRFINQRHLNCGLRVIFNGHVQKRLKLGKLKSLQWRNSVS